MDETTTGGDKRVAGGDEPTTGGDVTTGRVEVAAGGELGFGAGTELGCGAGAELGFGAGAELGFGAGAEVGCGAGAALGFGAAGDGAGGAAGDFAGGAAADVGMVVAKRTEREKGVIYAGRGGEGVRMTRVRRDDVRRRGDGRAWQHPPVSSCCRCQCPSPRKDLGLRPTSMKIRSWGRDAATCPSIETCLRNSS